MAPQTASTVQRKLGADGISDSIAQGQRAPRS
jgi:hypothetical protein